LCRVGVLTAWTLLLYLAPAHLMCGQAWIPRKGEGSVAVVYQNVAIVDHLNGDGSRFDGGQVQAHGVLTYAEYGLRSNLALNLSLPYIASSYHGDKPHQLPIDNGDYHSTFQDFGIGLRYSFGAHGFAITPFIAGVVPSHGYEFFAHSAVGNRVPELRLGAYVGRQLAPRLPKAYFQVRYSYGITKRVDGVRPNHSNFDSEFGYFVTRRLAIRALEGFQVSHDGLNSPQDFPSRTDYRWRHHDQTLRVNFLNLGGGVSVAVSKSVDVFASVVTTVWGENGHALQRGLSVGVNWNFRSRRAESQVASQELHRVVTQTHTHSH